MTACGISIHAAREGGDATDIYNGYKRTKISIHAAREGGDFGGLCTSLDTNNFNPRRP